MGQIQLKFTLCLKRLELMVIWHLTLHESEEAVANSKDWEMLIFILVMLLSPLENSLNRPCIVNVAMGNQRF